MASKKRLHDAEFRERRYGSWTSAAALITQAGESGDEQYLVQAGSVLGDLSRIEREAMQAR